MGRAEGKGEGNDPEVDPRLYGEMGRWLGGGGDCTRLLKSLGHTRFTLQVDQRDRCKWLIIVLCWYMDLHPHILFWLLISFFIDGKNSMLIYLLLCKSLSFKSNGKIFFVKWAPVIFFSENKGKGNQISLMDDFWQGSVCTGFCLLTDLFLYFFSHCPEDLGMRATLFRNLLCFACFCSWF